MFENLSKRLTMSVGLMLAWGATHAAEITPLPGLSLNPGDTYRYIFATSIPTTAQSSDIATYNAFANSVAGQTGSLFEGSGITWFAWGSTQTVDAIDNIGGPFSESIYRVDGARIAASSTALISTATAMLEASINLDEFGDLVSGVVWTGTADDGTKNSPFGDTDVTLGLPFGTNQLWTMAGTQSNTIPHSIYAVSEELVVPTTSIPVPSSIALLLISLFALVRTRRARMR